jgi:aspartate-semialdehyde dehydrogenase
MIVALGRAARRYELRELVVASYQAASGAGQIGIDTLYDQIAAVAGDRAAGSTRVTSARRSTTSGRSPRRSRSTSCRGPDRCATAAGPARR